MDGRFRDGRNVHARKRRSRAAARGKRRVGIPRSHTDEMHIIYERSRAQLVSSLVNTVVLLESRMRVLSVHRVWFRNRVRFVILPTDPDGTARDCGPKAGTGDAAAISEDMQQPKAWQGILDAAAARGAGRDVLARPCVVAARVRRSRSEQRGGG